jgi:hypothetical protein
MTSFDVVILAESGRKVQPIGNFSHVPSLKVHVIDTEGLAGIAEPRGNTVNGS